MAKRSRKRKDTAQDKKQTKKQIALGRRQARQNRIIMISVSALAAVIILILLVGVVQELIIKPSKPVAMVNGEKIRTDEFQDVVTFNRFNQYLYMSNLQASLEELGASPEENQFLISFYEQQLAQLESSLITLPQSTLDEMIDGELIRQKAVAEGISVTQEEVDQAIDDYLQRYLPQAQEPLTVTEELPTPTPVPQKELDQYYENERAITSLSVRSYRTIFERYQLSSKMQDLLAGQVATTGLVVNAQLIKTETEAEAQAAKQRIEGGEEFEVVAQEVSTDTITAGDGGDLGWVTTGQLSGRYGEALETLVFSMEVGTLDMVESNGMFYVVRVNDRDEEGPLPADVLSSRQSSALRAWLDEQAASPEVQIERLLQPDQIPPDRLAGRPGF